jgi:hypothetical protein
MGEAGRAGGGGAGPLDKAPFVFEKCSCEKRYIEGDKGTWWYMGGLMW